MVTRANRPRPPMLAMVVLAVTIVAACTATPTPTPPPSGSAAPPGPVVSSPGEGLGALPGVEDVSYRAEDGAAQGFLDGAQDTLGEAVEIRIVQSAVATHGDEEVTLVAFGFPGMADADAVDAFARVLDDMEDAFQAGSQRGLGGDAYLMSNDGRSVVLGPWGRSGGHLVFLFALGPTGITEQLAAAILGVEG